MKEAYCSHEIVKLLEEKGFPKGEFTHFFVCDLCLIAYNCFYVSLVAGLTVEYKGHLYGNRFDWLDILSTVLPAFAFFIGIIIAELL